MWIRKFLTIFSSVCALLYSVLVVLEITDVLSVPDILLHLLFTVFLLGMAFQQENKKYKVLYYILAAVYCALTAASFFV